METIVKHSQPGLWQLRSLGMITAAALFLFSTFHLVISAGGNGGIWRFVAMGSLYGCFCLMQRRLLVPAKRSNERYGQDSHCAE